MPDPTSCIRFSSVFPIVYAGSDFPHPFQLGFSKESMDYIVQKRPGSDLDGLVKDGPNTLDLEANWCAGSIGPAF